MSLASIVLRRPYILRPTSYLLSSSNASFSTTSMARKAAKSASTIKKEFMSECPAGFQFQRLALFKDQPVPQAMKDEEYPEWLWTLLDQPKGKDLATAAKQVVKEGEVMDFDLEKKRLRQINKAKIKENNFLKSTG